MISGHFFKRIRNRRRVGKGISLPNNRTLLALLSHNVIERFVRIREADILAIPLLLPRSEDSDEFPENPCHPACAEHAESDYCRESWQLHLAELTRRPETHWHKCDYGRLCAYIPIVFRNQRLAAVKLASPAMTDEKVFEHHVELLDVLVKDFINAEADFLDRLLCADAEVAKSRPSAGQTPDESVERIPEHPQILRALRYIEEHLSESRLTVARVARELDIHPDYLSHLFAEHVGQRMSKFITARRVELAKTLLTTTDRQIKRIAHDTGHANPNWFCHIFNMHTGLSPGAYRKKSRIEANR